MQPQPSEESAVFRPKQTRRRPIFPLTAKQLRFVDEFLVDLNATQAAIRSGYSARSARKTGYDNLRVEGIADAIAKQQKERSERLAVTKDRLVEEAAKSAYANILDYVTIAENGEPSIDLSRLTRDQAAAIHEITVDTYSEGRGDDKREVKRVRFKLNDKTRNIELLGKFNGHFVEKHEHSGPDGRPIALENLSDIEVARRIAFTLTKALADAERALPSALQGSLNGKAPDVSPQQTSLLNPTGPSNDRYAEGDVTDAEILGETSPQDNAGSGLGATPDTRPGWLRVFAPKE